MSLPISCSSTRERRTEITKTVRETEAEAIAFVVGKSIGLKTSTASADYISLYHGNAALLMESLELVQQTAAVILAAIQPEESVSQEAAQEAAELPAARSQRPNRNGRGAPATRHDHTKQWRRWRNENHPSHP